MGGKRKIHFTHIKNKTKKMVDAVNVETMFKVEGGCVLTSLNIVLDPFGVNITAEELDGGAPMALAKRNNAGGGQWFAIDVCDIGKAWSIDCVLEALKVKGKELNRFITMTRLKDFSVLTEENSCGKFVVFGVLNRNGGWVETVSGEQVEAKRFQHALVVDRDVNMIFDVNDGEGGCSFSKDKLKDHLEDISRVFTFKVDA